MLVGAAAVVVTDRDQRSMLSNIKTFSRDIVLVEGIHCNSCLYTTSVLVLWWKHTTYFNCMACLNASL